MYRIALCDDDKNFLELLEERVKEYCERNNLSIIIQSFFDSDILAEQIEDKKYFDIYILDVEMPRYSGVELAKLINRLSDSAYIILLTAHEAYAIEACGINIAKYILKKNLDSSLKSVLDQMFICLNQMKSNKIYIISNQRKFVKLHQRNIIYAYKNQKSTIFVLEGGIEESERIPLQDVHNRMDNKDMVLIDRGLIINLVHIRKIAEKKIIMDEGYELITSKIHIMELKELLNTYWGEIL